MSKNEIKPLSRKSDIVFQDQGNEILIYDLTINKAFCLNETSALVWQICDGNRTVSEISSQLSRQLNSSVNEEFVWLALEQFKKDNLLENKEEISLPFEGFSRRDVIRRVGLATVVALPIVSSLIAPTAVQAAGSACSSISCRCPNNTATPLGNPNCAGNSQAAGYVNCNTAAGNTCDCVGPYGANDSAGSGFKTGNGCQRTA